MESNPYLVIIDAFKNLLESQQFTIVNEETRDGKTHIIYTSGKMGGRPVNAVVTYFGWPRIIRVSIKLIFIKKLKRHLVYNLLNVINNRLCPGHFKINKIGHVILESGMFVFEHFLNKDGPDSEWHLEGEFHLLLDHLREAAATYLPLIRYQLGCSGSTGSIIRAFEKELKINGLSSLQDRGVELLE